jgi:hypothetical protein
MVAISSFLTDDRVVKVANTTVARAYLIRDAIRSDPAPSPTVKVASFRGEVGKPCLTAASAVERVIEQLNECPDRIVRPRGGGIAFIFLAGARYAMLETDEEGTTVALLSDRSTDSEAETWVVEADGLTMAVRKIRSFLGLPHGTQP